MIKILFPTGVDSRQTDNNIIKYVPYDIRKIDFDQYDNYNEDDNDYVGVMLGIETPNMLLPEYTEYIFSNRFFDRIAHIVETTP